MESQIPIIKKLNSQNNGPELLNEHHIAGVFYNYFPDSPLRNSCQVQYKKQWIHNQVIIEQIEELGQKACDHATKACILKGSHLLLDLYTDLGSRFLSDIDLLISENDIAQWEVILTELGFQAIIQKSFYGNRFKKEWCKKLGEIEINIELHTKLFFHLKNENWQFENTPFSNITKLKSEDLFIHLCGHLASQHTFLKLYWLFDIYFYFQKHASSMDWNYLQLTSLEHGLYRSVQMCLWILSQHFGVKLEKKIDDQFEITSKHWWEKLLTADFLMYPLASKSRYFLLKHATKDRLSAALHYDLSWFYHYKLQKFWSKQ